MNLAALDRAHDLLRQRRLERGLPAELPALQPPQRLLQQGAAIAAALLALVLLAGVGIGQRSRQLAAERARLRAIPAQVQALETQVRAELVRLRRQDEANTGLARGLVALSSGSALLSQLAQLTPQGVQITEATVADQTLRLKGRADDPAPFERVNALSLLLADRPMFRPDVRVIKLARPAPPTDPGVSAPLQPVDWQLQVSLASLTPAQQLPLLRRLGADGMALRLQDLLRTGVLR